MVTHCPSPPDKGIGEIQRACEEAGYVMLVTADHGNAERMIDEEGKPVTKHTTYRGELPQVLLLCCCACASCYCVSWKTKINACVIASVVMCVGYFWKVVVIVVSLC